MLKESITLKDRLAE